MVPQELKGMIRGERPKKCVAASNSRWWENKGSQKPGVAHCELPIGLVVGGGGTINL